MQGVDKVLIGNKCDMKDQRVIDTSRGEALAKEYGIKFFETSAKNNENVTEAFYDIACDIKKRLMADPPATKSGDRVVLGSGSGGSKEGCCK
jgi:Ras-related protein Rab-8A